METIGAVSTVFGIVTSVLQITLEISNLISGIRNASHSLQRLDQELRDLEAILTQIEQTEAKHGLYSPAADMSLKSCRDELRRLQGILEPLGLRSIGSGIRRRTLQGFIKLFRDKEIDNAVNALQSRKLSICLALMTDLARSVISTGGLHTLGCY